MYILVIEDEIRKVYGLLIFSVAIPLKLIRVLSDGLSRIISAHKYCL